MKEEGETCMFHAWRVHQYELQLERLFIMRLLAHSIPRTKVTELEMSFTLSGNCPNLAMKTSIVIVLGMVLFRVQKARAFNASDLENILQLL
jgi:hypothetical protein